MLVLVVDRRADARIELDILAQIELIGDIVEVALVLRLAGEVLFPVPFLQQFLREGVAVGFTLGIEAAPWVAVPIPGTAYAPSVLKDPHRKLHLPQTVQLI